MCKFYAKRKFTLELRKITQNHTNYALMMQITQKLGRNYANTITHITHITNITHITHIMHINFFFCNLRVLHMQTNCSGVFSCKKLMGLSVT
jgi:hypothetical protein